MEPNVDVDYGFEVGERERHHVEFHWGRSWAEARISVDGVEVLREKHPFGVRMVRRYQVEVGDTEVHSVVVEKTKKKLYGGLRRQSFKAFVDGELVGEF